MQLIALKGVKFMSVGQAKSKIASFYPNLHTWLQKAKPGDHDYQISMDFKKELEPLLSLKQNVEDLDNKSRKLNFLIRELDSVIKK